MENSERYKKFVCEVIEPLSKDEIRADKEQVVRNVNILLIVVIFSLLILIV